MKQLFSFLLLFTSVINLMGQENTVIVTGHVLEAQNKLVAIKYEHTLFENKEKFIGNIGTNGFFVIKFTMDYPQNVLFIYDNDLMSLFLHPGDSLNISFNGSKGIDSVVFSGDHAERNKKLLQFSKGYGEIYNLQPLWAMKKEKQPKTFKQLVNGFRTKCDSMIKDLRADDEITKWMQLDVKYRCFEALYEYGMDNNISPDNNYYNFIPEYTLDNNAGLCCTRFTDFIDSYIQHNYMLNKPIMDSLRSFYKNKDYGAYLKLCMEFYQQLNSKLANVALTEIFYEILSYDLKTVENLLGEYNSTVENNLFVRLLSREIEKYKLKMASQNEYVTIKQLATNEIVGSLFTDLSKKYPNKVLYIDFWGASCSHCLKQFPYAKALHDSLKDKDVVFVYFSKPSGKDIWNGRIKKYEIKGEHYMLTSDQWVYLQSLLNFGGTPTYMIVDKQGRFVNKDANRPGYVKDELSKYAEM